MSEPLQNEYAAPPSLSRKRTQTRERLLAAALDVFAEVGLGGATVELLCERAGFTRGAFYSNYKSLDELLLALFAQQAERLMQATAAALEAQDSAAEPLPQEQSTQVFLKAIPQDRRWFLIHNELVMHAMRNPDAREAFVAQQARIRDGVADVLRASFSRRGLQSTVDIDLLVRWIAALHEGLLTQTYLEPERWGPEDLALTAVPALITAVTYSTREGAPNNPA